MRGVGRLASNTTTSRKTLIYSSSFSTFAGGSSSGRGRGRGSDPPKPSPLSQPPGKTAADAEPDDNFLLSGLGHGRGKPIPSTPILPSFSSWISPPTASAGRGRTERPDSAPQEPKKPIFFRRQDVVESPQPSDSIQDQQRRILPQSLPVGLPGAGRGKPAKLEESGARVSEVNRHVRARSAGSGQRASPSPPWSSSPRLSRGDAAEGGGRGGGFRGGRGRGGRGMYGRRGRGGRGRGGRSQEDRDDFETGLYLGDNADGERLANRLGEENMNKLIEGFEEISGSVLPNPMDEAYLDALHTNNMIEYEPEYLMGDFETNPDIDEKPPIPLRDALEKMKPFLMEYEGIQSQEEWEEIMKETMDKVPIMKELIDFYSGPDRVTAKQQQQELERVAKTLPDNIPSSVKRFTDRALLSLQSNPGWGFDKKCQFMDKLVWEISKDYK